MSSRLDTVPLSRETQDRVNLQDKVPFEAADHLHLRHPLGSPARHVHPRTLIVTEPDDDHAMECRISPAIAASMRPVTVDLSELSAHRKIRPIQIHNQSLYLS
jgi:hypothetical protein